MTTIIDSTPPSLLYTSDFFRTNLIYSEEKKRCIRRHLHYATRTLVDVLERRRELTYWRYFKPVDEDVIRELRRQEGELEDCIERCKLALAPVKALPDDVLRYIFTLCCGPNSSTIFPLVFRGPLRSISVVCSTWRGLVLATPTLWSRLHIYYHRRAKCNFSHLEDSIKFWLLQASTCLVSLEAEVRPSCDLAVRAKISDLISRIIALPRGYRRLYLTFTRSELDSQLGRLSPNQLSNVEELEIIDATNELGQPTSGAAALNVNKSSFAEIWITHISRSPIPFHGQLRMLDLSYAIPMSLGLGLLKQCPSLEKAWFEFEEEPSGSTTLSSLANGVTHIVLPTLQYLVITFSEGEDCAFLDCLVLVNLRSLSINVLHQTPFPANKMMESVTGLSGRSGTPKMHYLALDCQLVPPLKLLTLLRYLPYLERISAEGEITLDEKTLDGLSSGILGSCLLALEASEVDGNRDDIANMVEQRAQNVKKPRLQISLWSSFLGDHGWEARVPSIDYYDFDSE